MQVLHDFTDCPDALRGASLAIGNFDGVHLGHQAVLNAALENDSPAGVMTFEPHPRSFFQKDKALFRLTPEPLKLRLFEALGLDMAVVLKFDGDLASRPAEDFVRHILVENLQVSHVITGSDFHFGRGRDGNPDVLCALGKKHGFGVTVVGPQEGEEGVYSSTGIREQLRQGNPRSAAQGLGYWWRVAGEVIGGDKRGAGLGFPTANIAISDGFALKYGIYAVRVHTRQGCYDGASYLGTRPSFDDGAAVLETFLFNFDGDLYGQEIAIEVIDFLRDDEKFAGAESLQAQMKKDCDKARTLLAQLNEKNPMQDFVLGKALA